MNRWVIGPGDDVVVGDGALSVYIGLDDDDGVMIADDGAGADRGVEIVRGGHGSQGLVVGHDRLRRGDHAEEKSNASNENDGSGETCGYLYEHRTDGVVPLQAQGVEPACFSSRLFMRDGKTKLESEIDRSLRRS